MAKSSSLATKLRYRLPSPGAQGVQLGAYTIHVSPDYEWMLREELDYGRVGAEESETRASEIQFLDNTGLQGAWGIGETGGVSGHELEAAAGTTEDFSGFEYEDSEAGFAEISRADQTIVTPTDYDGVPLARAIALVVCHPPFSSPSSANL